MFLAAFPDFNLYSTPLLILIIQGLFFAGLLLKRYIKKRAVSDLLLVLIILITCYDRTSYTIGFMSWYDTYRTTKINYFLFELSLVLAPFLYFYVKAVTSSVFKFSRRDLLHFIPWFVYLGIKLFIYFTDASSANFSEVQNGAMVTDFQWPYLNPIVSLFSMLQMVVYLVLSFQMYFSYKHKIQDFFSNTHTVALKWLRNFLIVYAFLFVFNSVQSIIDTSIVELSWIQSWWYHFFSAIAIIYIAIKGYFTPVGSLKDLGFSYENFSFNKQPSQKIEVTATEKKAEALTTALLKKKEHLADFIEKEQSFLDPDITLVTLAKQMGMSREELSEVINKGFQLKFNDFINSYRIAAVKEMLLANKQADLSLIGIAFECGFNSKPTFNRVFKKLEGCSPTQFITNSK